MIKACSSHPRLLLLPFATSLWEMRENRIGDGERGRKGVVVGGLLSPEIKVSALKNCARLFKGAPDPTSRHMWTWLGGQGM